MKKKFYRVFLLLCVVSLSASVSATTIFVSNTNDAGSGSLRSAVAASVNGDTIRFNASLVASGNDTIKLATPIAVSSNLVIIGLKTASGSLYISGQSNSQIFNFSSLTMTLDSLLLIDGRATNGGAIIMTEFNAVLNIHNCLFNNNTATQRGGAVHFYSGELNIENSVFTHNTSTAEGGAVYHQIAQTLSVYGTTFENNNASKGGAVCMVSGGNSSNLSVINSQLNTNQSSLEGGAIYFEGRYFTMDSSIVNSNTAGGNLYHGIIFLGNLSRLNNTISNSIISQNTGIGVVAYISLNNSTSVETETTISYCSINNNIRGGVVSTATTVNANAISRVIVSQSTIAGNGALIGNYVHGGIYSTATLLATGYTVNSNVSVTNSTITNNLAPYDGSGVFSSGKTNASTSLTLKSCIVSGNSGIGLYRFSGTAGINSSGYNIFSESNIINTVATDQLGVSAGSLNLSPLDFYGGFGHTMMPGTNSVAINAGTPTDNVRPQNGAILGGRRDVGAAENIPACEVFYSYAQSICFGDSVLFKGMYRKTSGAYRDTIAIVGCDSIVTLNLTVHNNPTANISPATISICNGASATLTASGGTTYAWSNSLGNGASKTVSPTSTTTYTVTVTDGNNCSATASRLVTVNQNPTANISPATISICNGASATLTASGGTTYAWSNSLGNGASKTVSPTSTTTYTVTVTDGNNCSATASRLVTVNQNPTANISPATISICNGASATLTASGGTTYAWSNSLGNGASKTVSPTSTTTYTVTVTDGNNCSATASRLVTINQNPTANISPATISICNGASATLTASGGTTYAWSNSLGNGASKTVSPTSTTTYTVTVTDGNNCSATASRLVTVNQNPTANISPATISICNGASATLTASGGTTYAWSNSLGNGASKTVSPTSTTTYTVTVTDGNNCSATASRLVTINQNPTANISPATISICNGASATLTASGGTTYAWSNSLGNGASKTVSPTSTTTYTVTVTDGNNCSATASRLVTINQNPTANISPATISICNGASATLTASGGTTYAWSNSLGNGASKTVSPTSTTTYTVTVTDGNNCSATASRLVTINQNPTANISPATISICNGASATLTASGGTTYAWSNSLGNGASKTVSPTSTTTYTVTVTNTNNCTASASKTVSIIQPTSSQISQTICAGSAYNFGGNALTQSGTYTNVLQNVAGCDSTVTLTLTVLTSISSVVNVSICQGASYDFNGTALTNAGTYTQTLQGASAQGCDSAVTLNLTVGTFIGSNILKSICQGESFVFNSKTLTQSGVYSDTLATSSCDSIVTLTLTVNTLPTPTIIQNGNQLSTQSFNSYQWKLNGNNINNETTQNHTATQNGNYTVVVVDANECSNTSNAVNVTGVSIHEVLDFRCMIYPNPTTSELMIESDEMIEAITVADVMGRVIFTQSKNINQKSNIDVSNLTEAVYFIQLKTISGKTAVKSFLKQ